MRCDADKARLGCSVEELLKAIRDSLAPPGSSSQTAQQGPPDRAASEVWKWLVRRSDVSVGHGREHNHLPLPELLSLPQLRPLASNGPEEPGATQARERLEGDPSSVLDDAIRVHISEATMWEAITGHAVDHKRVPRSEWLLLLGIASSKSDGILQGDLGRLVDQDKRSVPKRTDSLVKKGYIVKRTTLIRGTKTSKMWLRSLVPPLPRESDPSDELKVDMNLSRQTLAENLDPVPWRICWTGPDIDYRALATTIMALAKEWDVIRVRDLKEKLGVLGMRWQMKIVSKTCRFLNSRGAIQYVAAKLENRVFKDCVKFTRDMTAEDWSIYLSTGKHPGKPARGSERIVSDEDDGNERLSMQRASNARLSMCPPWSLDTPLPQAITRAVQSLGNHGLSNPDIYMLTLGATFNRFLSSMTGSLSTTDIQPPHLKHLQMRSEHIRTGKVASYLFYLPPALTSAEAAASGPVEKAVLPEIRDMSASLGDLYGFLPATAVPTHTSSSLAVMCGLRLPRKGGGTKGTRRRARETKHVERQQADAGCPAEPDVDVTEMARAEKSKPSTTEGQHRARQCPSRLVTLRLRPESMRLAMMENRPTSPLSPQRSSAKRQTVSPLEGPGKASRADPVESREAGSGSTPDDALPPTMSTRGRGSGRPRGRPRGSGRGRVRKPPITQTSGPTSPRPWRCEKCGGSWKNDIGLKYHLEKSRTSCNPSYTPLLAQATRKGKQSSFFRPKTSSPSVEMGPKSPTGSRTPCPDRNAFGPGDPPTSPLYRGSRDGEQIFEQLGYAREIPALGTEQAAGTWPQSSPAGIEEARHELSPPHANPGVLLSDEPVVPRQILAFSSRQSLPESPAPGPLGKEDVADLAPSAHGMDTAEDARISGTLLTEDRSCVISAQQETPEPRHPSPGIQNAPNGAGGAGNTKQKKTPRDRICDLIGDFLDDNNDVILGGKSLLHAVTAAWPTFAPDLPQPTSRACHSAVNTMIRTKVVTEHWHAFRDRKGLFAKCQLILRPGIDAFSPECMHLVEMAKDAQFPPDEPSRMDDSDNAESQGKKSRARGRRLLAKEVAILDAPVYAAQVAAKRAAEAASGSPHRPKRVKYSARKRRGDDHELAVSPEQASKGIRFAVGGLGGRHAAKWLGDPADCLAFIQPAAAIHFLDPNTYLRDESPPSELEESSVPIDPQLTQGEEQEPDVQQQSATPARPDAYVFDDIKPIVGSFGSWPELDSHEFDRLGTSFTLSGWIPDRKWLRWTAFGHEVEKRCAAREARLFSSASAAAPYQRVANRIRACLEAEALCRVDFANAVPGDAGPHNIFVSVFGEDGEDASRLPLNLVWPAEGQLTLTSAHDGFASTLEGEQEPSSSDDVSSPDPFAEKKTARVGRRGVKFAAVVGVRQQKIKRVALVTRALTALPAQSEGSGDTAEATEDSAELMAAFIAIRSLLGGAEKAIDWGLLARLFPNLGLTHLRKFWADARKEQAAYISNFTRVFQERLITALDEEELPMIDFDKPLDYDWDNLIQWTVQLPRQEGLQIPRSRDSLTKQYSLRDVKATGEDWREKYFHVVSSFFARYEAVSSEPGTVTVGEASRGFHESPRIDELTIARSWIKSLCSTAETEYSAEQVKSRFLQLAARSKQRRSELLKEAAAQLAHQRVICRKERPLVRGRPYRLNEWYLSTLAKNAQSAKYDEAAAFKHELDSTFRREESMRVPYTLNDGAMMALTNLNAAGRIRLVPVDVPDIPFGFEPGRYESRKTPKSCYHFALEAVPTPTYQYNEEIQVLRDVVRQGPPGGGPQGESPQWVDIFGQSNVQRWSELLGAFCFAFATRGSMTIEGICSALHPLLDEFEAHLIVAWGKRTGVLTDLMDDVGTTVGDWWWLAVPWTRQQTGGRTGEGARSGVAGEEGGHS